MKQLESGLLKDDILIPCFYYEVEKKCVEIVNEYCKSSEYNQKTFHHFAKCYCSFSPYFDFVVCHLGYKILNPELEPNIILYGKENHMYKYKENSNISQKFCYDLSDDQTLKIKPMKMDSSTFHDCLIDGNGNHLLPDDMFGHVHILQQLLNLLLISSKKICYDYEKYNGDIGFFVGRYIPLLRFQADFQGKNILTRVVFRKDNITQKQKDFISDLIDNHYTYPSFILDASSVDPFKESKDMCKSLKYIKK